MIAWGYWSHSFRKDDDDWLLTHKYRERHQYCFAEQQLNLLPRDLALVVRQDARPILVMATPASWLEGSLMWLLLVSSTIISLAPGNKTLSTNGQLRWDGQVAKPLSKAFCCKDEWVPIMLAWTNLNATWISEGWKKKIPMGEKLNRYRMYLDGTIFICHLEMQNHWPLTRW